MVRIMRIRCSIFRFDLKLIRALGAVRSRHWMITMTFHAWRLLRHDATYVGFIKVGRISSGPIGMMKG